jgi:hypothetical protein
MAKGLKMLIAYPGWQVGTGRFMAGMARGLYKTGKGLASKEGINLDYQAKRSLQFGLGLVVTNAIANSILQYAMIQKWPEDWKDAMVGARTGRTLSNGAPERIAIASYMKDLMSTPRHPLKAIDSKLMFPVHMIRELYNNADHSGTEIVPRKGTAIEGAAGLGKYMGQRLLPFGFSGFVHGKSDVAKWGGLAGLRMVPREFSSTPALNKIDQILGAHAPKVRTQAEADKSKLKAQLRDMGWNGDKSGMEAGLREAKQKGMLTQLDVNKIRMDVRRNKLDVQFRKLSRLEDALEVYMEATPEERAIWKPQLRRKVYNSRPETKRRLRDQIKEAMTL